VTKVNAISVVKPLLMVIFIFVLHFDDCLPEKWEILHLHYAAGSL